MPTAKKPKYVVRWTAVLLSSMIQTYIDGMEATEGKIVSTEWYMDAAKDTVIVKAFVEVEDAPDN